MNICPSFFTLQKKFFDKPWVNPESKRPIKIGGRKYFSLTKIYGAPSYYLPKIDKQYPDFVYVDEITNFDEIINFDDINYFLEAMDKNFPLDPILIKKDNNKYVIIDGKKRLIASIKHGYNQIPVFYN